MKKTKGVEPKSRNPNSLTIWRIGRTIVLKELHKKVPTCRPIRRFIDCPGIGKLKVVSSSYRKPDKSTPCWHWGWGLVRKKEKIAFTHVVCVALDKKNKVHNYYIINRADVNAFPQWPRHYSEKHSLIIADGTKPCATEYDELARTKVKNAKPGTLFQTFKNLEAQS